MRPSNIQIILIFTGGLARPGDIKYNYYFLLQLRLETLPMLFKNVFIKFIKLGRIHIEVEFPT